MLIHKLVNEAANDSARVSARDRKKPPALGTNHIAEFGESPPPLPRWQDEKKKKTLLILMQCLQLFIAYELQINFWAC